LKLLGAALALVILGVTLGTATAAQDGPRLSLRSLEYGTPSGEFLVEMEISRGIATASPNAGFTIQVTLHTGVGAFERVSPVAALPSRELPMGGSSITLPIPASLSPGRYQVRVIGLSASGSGQIIGTFSDAITLVVE